MKCPHCGFNDSKVLDSRDTGEGIRRRRQCLSCNDRFTTQEKYQKNNIFVIKKDKRREPFQKEKILLGIRKACQKRPIAEHIISKIVDEIESELIVQGRAEISSTMIGDMVMEQLKYLDHIAYIRFASVYREFADITRLKQEVDSLAGEGTGETSGSQQLPLLPGAMTSVVAKTGGRRHR